MGDTKKMKDTSPDTSGSDSESQSSEADNLLPSISEPDVSLDEMLSLACRQGKLDIVQLLLQSGAHVNHRNKAGNTPLLEACSQGHVSVANYLLENGSKIDAPTETTLDSALTWACTLGNTSIVDALLQKKADVEHRTKDGCTALMFACLAGHRDVAEKLLDARSEINVESESNKDSPLTFACWKGHYDVVELLLKRNANIEHRTKEGFSPLMFAALGGHSKVARKLLQSDAQVNVPSGSNNDIPLTSACWKGHHNVVKLLLEYNSNIEHRTKDGCTPLMLAAREGHIHVADLLLKNNAQVNVPSGSENNIPLTLACWKGHWEVVRLLLNHNSNIEHRNKAGCTPLMLAAREGHFETTSLLLERNAQLNIPSGSNDDTPLTLACWKGHKDVVVLLLNAKSNIDHQTKTGCTPLMEATREGHKGVAEILLNHNADVELPDNYGQSPLFMACWKGHRDVAELLLQRSAYRDCRTKTGITPLFQACRENHISIVELLLEYGAGVNTPFPNSRENPMTLCAEKGHRELVEMLLSKGGSHDCHTKKGCTPIFLACKEGHMDIANILLQQGASPETSDCRGNTPIMAAFKNGHVHVVEWLINFVHHLPSDELCHKILMSSIDEKDKEIAVQQRSKCLATIQEMKKKRELLALKNAQNLVQELDDERDREEKKKKKKAAKRRDKNKRKKTSKESEKLDTKLNGIISNHVDDDDELDEEELKDNILPTENRIRCGDSPINIDVLKISEMSTLPESRVALLREQEKTRNLLEATRLSETTTTTSSQKQKQKQQQELLVNGTKHNQSTKNKDETTANKIPHHNHCHNNNNIKDVSPTKRLNGGEHLFVDIASLEESRNSPTGSSSPVEVIQLINKRLNISNNISKLNSRQLPKTSGVATQSSSTSGPSRVAVSSQTEKSGSTTQNYISVTSNTQSSSSSHNHGNKKQHQQKSVPAVSSVAVSTSSTLTTSCSDPRMEYRNIAPPEVRQNSWEEETDSRNSFSDEYRESDWKELSRTTKLVFFELTVPNSYCGRVIGKGGKKINLITDDSGAQITIDKPPSHVVPANRVITIKGAPGNAEKARHLVTKALNTPSLSNQEIVASTPTPPSQSITSISSSKSHSMTTVHDTPNNKDENSLLPPFTTNVDLGPATPSSGKKKRPQKPLASSEVPVTPLISYSRVTKASSTLEELQKEILQTKNQYSTSSSPKTSSSSCDKQTENKTEGDGEKKTEQESEPQHEQPEQPQEKQQNSGKQTTPSKESSPSSNENESRDKKYPFQPDNSDSTFFYYDSYNARKISEPNEPSSRFPFGDARKNLAKVNWPSTNSQQTLHPDDNPLGIDRSRSISWTGRPKGEGLLYESSSGACRSMSTDQLDTRKNNSSNNIPSHHLSPASSAWSHVPRNTHPSIDDVDVDEQVFTEDMPWGVLGGVKSSMEGVTGIFPNNPSGIDAGDISSSPTSSVSSSKVELTNYFDNDSGVGGSSNPLDPTPISVQDESQLSNFQDGTYLDTALEPSAEPWYQQRGAYSAPSSPALPRTTENISGASSPGPSSIRSHPSMDGINGNHHNHDSHPWSTKDHMLSEQDQNQQRWSTADSTSLSSSSLPLSRNTPSSSRNNVSTGTLQTFQTNNRSQETNHDSGLSSPRSNSGLRMQHSQNEIRSTSKNQQTIKAVCEPELSNVPPTVHIPPNPASTSNHVAKQWSVERFQDVKTLSDLLKQLSLEKYTQKLEQNGINLESIVTLSERDLQQFEVPKGPRLKILKACEVIKGQKQLSLPMGQTSILPQQKQHSLPQQSTPQQSQQLPPPHQHNIEQHILQQQHHAQQPRFFVPPAAVQSSAINHTLLDQPPIAMQTNHAMTAFNEKQFPLHPSQQQQQMFQTSYRFPDFLSYPPQSQLHQHQHHHQQQQQQQNFNIILPANNQPFLQQQQQQHRNPHSIQQQQMLPPDDFPIPHISHPPPPPNIDSLPQQPPQIQQSNQTLLSQQFLYQPNVPDNQAFYYFQPQS